MHKSENSDSNLAVVDRVLYVSPNRRPLLQPDNIQENYPLGNNITMFDFEQSGSKGTVLKFDRVIAYMYMYLYGKNVSTSSLPQFSLTFTSKHANEHTHEIQNKYITKNISIRIELNLTA